MTHSFCNFHNTYNFCTKAAQLRQEQRQEQDQRQAETVEARQEKAAMLRKE